MGKPDCEDSQLYGPTPSPSPPLRPPTDFDMHWHGALSQSEPSIQSRQQNFLNRFAAAAAAYNSSSYKVSIGHETVNITEIARHRDGSTDPGAPIGSVERRRIFAARRGANILSLCFMSFVSATLMLISIATMHLLLKTNYNNSDMIPLFIQSANSTPGLIFMLAAPIPSTDKSSNGIVPFYDRTIRDLANVLCLLIVVLNCFCLLVFSIEIYLGCNLIRSRRDAQSGFSFLFSTSTSRFVAICGFYASIPALILVMCLYILLNMSLIPAIISLVVLGIGLIFILITLLTHFTTWNHSSSNSSLSSSSKLGGVQSSTYRPNGIVPLSEDEIDLAKIDELSTLV